VPGLEPGVPGPGTGTGTGSESGSGTPRFVQRPCEREPQPGPAEAGGLGPGPGAGARVADTVDGDTASIGGDGRCRFMVPAVSLDGVITLGVSGGGNRQQGVTSSVPPVVSQLMPTTQFSPRTKWAHLLLVPFP